MESSGGNNFDYTQIIMPHITCVTLLSLIQHESKELSSMAGISHSPSCHSVIGAQPNMFLFLLSLFVSYKKPTKCKYKIYDFIASFILTHPINGDWKNFRIDFSEDMCVDAAATEIGIDDLDASSLSFNAESMIL